MLNLVSHVVLQSPQNLRLETAANAAYVDATQGAEEASHSERSVARQGLSVASWSDDTRGSSSRVTLLFSSVPPALVVIQLLPRLVKRRIWDSEVLFKGFVHCIQRTQPDSFEVRSVIRWTLDVCFFFIFFFFLFFFFFGALLMS